jgi:hypothetical protein
MGILENLAARAARALEAPHPAEPAPVHFDLIMPPQDVTTPELRGGEAFKYTFTPGFLQKPKWPFEVWMLSSFQLQISGSMVAEDGELGEELSALAVVLALKQNNQIRWSTNLSLPLIPTPPATVPGNPLEFTFATGVFVDLQNPLGYLGGALLEFEISGIVPHFKP